MEPPDPDSLELLVVEVNAPNGSKGRGGGGGGGGTAGGCCPAKLAVAVTTGAAGGRYQRTLVLGNQWRELGFFVPDDRESLAEFLRKVRAVSYSILMQK